MDSELGLLLFNYIIIPFVSAFIISICIIEICRRLSIRNFSKHKTDLIFNEIEKQIKSQDSKTELISSQINIIYDKINKTDERISEIYDKIKLLDDQLQLINKERNRSNIFEISPILKHDKNFTNEMLSHNHINISQNHNQINDEDQSNGTIEYILRKLQDVSLTTTNIQALIGRSREHTSRLMKRLYEEDLVDRDVTSKPFRYTITDEGRKRLSEHSVLKIHSRFGH